MIKKIFILFIFVPTIAYSATVPGDIHDKTSLILSTSTATALTPASINFSDTSAKIGHLWQIDNRKSYAIEIKGKAPNGFSNVVDGNVLSKELSGTLSFAYHPLMIRGASEVGQEKQKGYEPSFIRDHWFSLQLGYQHGDYQVLNKSTTFDSTLTERRQDGLSADFFWNALTRLNAILGLSVGYTRTNNYDDLTKVSVVDVQTIASSGSTSRTIQKTVDAREGNFLEFNQLRSNIDLLYVPDSDLLDHRLGIDIFGRYSNHTGDESRVRPGLAFLLLQDPGAYKKIMAGIVLEKESGKTRFGFVAGYTF